ncbi:hypothetical protein FGM00_02620 [Aggregatimonas sangjinii]|uniref:Uncharacterized protein n=1 Tax=Aggregatimonas sangjinii TaxID=2583587 RepID=A0A5B7SPZ0_9FLAO|nr:hypothetical protein [Aggregatimonas sangjinii]QCW99062.1 hypothetical protein FGM00_02620 [Aggregatimonas sangjinii]
MELLELKSVWDVVVDETISQDKVDEFVVGKYIKNDSKSVLGKIKRVMYFKFTFGGLTLAGGIVMLTGSFITPEKFTFLENIFDDIDNRIFLANIILFMSAMLSWNFKAFREIQNFQVRPTSVKLSLERFIGIMGQAIKLNVYSSVVFNSIALGWICYLVNNSKGFVEGTLQMSFLIIGVVSISAVIFYFLSRIEQKMKFGNYLNQLKSNLKDLEEK